MSFPCHSHIFRSIQHQLHRFASMPRTQCRKTSNRCCLVFLTTKSASDAFHINLYLVVMDPKYLGNCSLSGVWTLGRSMNTDDISFHRNGPCPLGLKIYMFLSPNSACPFQDNITLLPCSIHIPNCKSTGSTNDLPHLISFFWISNDW